MNITKEKVEMAITLKGWYAKKLSEFDAGENELVGHDYHRGMEARLNGLGEFEASGQRNLFKEFLEGLSEDELQTLQAIGFYGRGEHGNFSLAQEEAAQMVQDPADIEYTMQILAAADYLEAGFEKLNLRHEI